MIIAYLAAVVIGWTVAGYALSLLIIPALLKYLDKREQDAIDL